jgi:hypothetical protein
MTMMPSFEFCAFRYLAQWEESEYALHNAIKSDFLGAVPILSGMAL